MKLRNKKTGEVVELIALDGSLNGLVEHEGGAKTAIGYHSLAELCEEWEDYQPTEPLIKDEEIREIIRVWAKVNDATNLKKVVLESVMDMKMKLEVICLIGELLVIFMKIPNYWRKNERIELNRYH